MTRKQMQSPDFQPDIAVLNDVPRAQRSTLLHKHLIPIIHVFQNSPPPSILLNYNLIIIINNMNPNKQSKRLRFTPHRISMQQQAKFLNASRDRATWPLTMLPQPCRKDRNQVRYPLHQENGKKLVGKPKITNFYLFDRSCTDGSFENFFFNISNINNIIFQENAGMILHEQSKFKYQFPVIVGTVNKCNIKFVR